ncbi:Beta-phosphoglucomutase [Phycisphaerae bacterium RAS1]|nr:Beta-phosphoglucomutase [Phycisphaerae bacterium RAS1]
MSSPRPELSAASTAGRARRATWAVIFDLDGVLTDTSELHYQSWQELADTLGIPFDRARNEALRGISRMESLRIVLDSHWEAFTPAQRQALTEHKNDSYVQKVAGLTPRDLFPGVERLLRELRAAGAAVAVASSSRNAAAVIERLGIAPLLDAVVDANLAPRSKPDPQVFLVAAEQVCVAPVCCVVVEDAESGVAAGLAAGMKVAGVGPVERVGRANVQVAATGDLTAAILRRLCVGE